MENLRYASSNQIHEFLLVSFQTCPTVNLDTFQQTDSVESLKLGNIRHTYVSTEETKPYVNITPLGPPFHGFHEYSSIISEKNAAVRWTGRDIKPRQTHTTVGRIQNQYFIWQLVSDYLTRDLHNITYTRFLTLHSAYSKRVFRTNCALRIKKCAPRISSGIYFLSTRSTS